MQITMTWARVLALGGALVLVACTPRYNKNRQATPKVTTPTPPAPRSMDQALTLGLWNSNFGAVRIERDPTMGEDAIMGIWLYDRQDEEVIGYFAGEMRGNLLEFGWHEPGRPNDLVGRGFISFENDGLSFNGSWWTSDLARKGAFKGWRDTVLAPSTPAATSPAADTPPPGQ